MIWKAKYTETIPEHGTNRLKRVFSWLPTYVNGDMVWLKTYEILQVFTVTQVKTTIESKEITFIYGEWLNVSKRLI